LVQNSRIVLTAPINPSAVDMLRQVAAVELSPSPDEQTLMGLLENTVGLVARGEGRVTRKMIGACPSLRVIGRPGAGYDSVDIAAATARKIPVVFAPVGSFAVVEGALALLLALVKQLPTCDRYVKGNQWQKRYEFATGDMAGHTLGIVGLGRIGSHLAKLAQPFEMTILGHDPVMQSDDARKMGVQLVAFDDLLSRSDYVSLHVPLTPETRGLINRATIARMKRGAILVNTSRGDVVESLDALADGLESGQLGAIGLDVFPVEPPDISHRIFRHPNCLCSPHVVGASGLAMERICQTMAQGMIDVLQGRTPPYCVNPSVLP
jgi:D-3-phosphoglycerate dehydrogenase